MTTNDAMFTLLRALRDKECDCMKYTLRDANGNLLSTVIVVLGQEEVKEILEAVEKVEERWQKED